MTDKKQDREGFKKEHKSIRDGDFSQQKKSDQTVSYDKPIPPEKPKKG